jgi:hypothetical protein
LDASLAAATAWTEKKKENIVIKAQVSCLLSINTIKRTKCLNAPCLRLQPFLQQIFHTPALDVSRTLDIKEQQSV